MNMKCKWEKCDAFNDQYRMTHIEVFMKFEEGTPFEYELYEYGETILKYSKLNSNPKSMNRSALVEITPRRESQAVVSYFPDIHPFKIWHWA